MHIMRLLISVFTCVGVLSSALPHDQRSVTFSNNNLPMRKLQQQQVTLNGDVYYDDNENGQRDDNENGVQMNFIQIRNCGDNSYAGRASTDANGKFTFTSVPGSFYPRFDFTRFTFPDGGAVDPATGRTECVTLEDGEAYSWSIAVTPEKEPTSSPVATPSLPPSTFPSVSPTVSFAPSFCLEKRNFTNNVMSSGPVSTSTYGMVFSVSSPETNELLVDDPVDAEYLYITSLSLRVFQPLTLLDSPTTKYQVWFKEGDYNQQSDWWGNFDGWTIISEGIASGNETVGQESMIQDTVFFSGVNASDSDLYDVLSLQLQDGGLSTFNSFGQQVTTYLYQIPPSNFKKVGIAKNGGKGSFYVTLDEPSLQGGDAEANDLDSINVENSNYDDTDYQDMNLRIHVGEAVRTYPWSQTSGFYKPKRFSGKVWYQQYLEIPCDEWEGMPSMSPTRIEIPPLLTEDGIPVETTFSLSLLFQRSLDEAEKMSADVAFAPAVLYLENLEWVFNHCIWGLQLDIISQDLSEPFRRRNLRGDTQYRILQADITLLKVVVSVEGYAHSDSSSCPAGATPTTPLEGKSWEDTLASIATTYTNENSGAFVDYLRDTDAYFADLISVSAAPAPAIDEPRTEAGVTTKSDEGTFPLIPVIAAVAAVVVILFVLCLCCFLRRRKRDNLYYSDSERNKETMIVSNIEEVENIKSKSVRDKFLAKTEITPVKKGDILKQACPSLQEQPLNEAMFRRGLLRCSSSPDMATVLSKPVSLRRRTRSIGCLRDVWVDLNRAHFSARPSFNPGYTDQLLKGKLYPVGDLNSFYNEAERNFLSGKADAFVPYGTDFDFTDPQDALYYDKESNMIMSSLRYENGDGGGIKKNKNEMTTSSTNPLVIQQVEMLEAKWKQLNELYDDEGDSDDDDIDLDAFNVESRIGLLMGRIEKMEEERQRKLAMLQQQEWEEEQALKKKRQVSSSGINYNKNFGKDLKIKKKKKKKNKVIDDLYLDDLSSESESDEEEEEGEFDVKWMRLKVPLAAQDPDTMRDMVNKGKDLS